MSGRSPSTTVDPIPGGASPGWGSGPTVAPTRVRRRTSGVQMAAPSTSTSTKMMRAVTAVKTDWLLVSPEVA